MMKSIQFLLIASSIFFFSSCQTDEISPENPEIELSFDIEHTNSTDNYSSKIKTVNLRERSAQWSEENLSEKVKLARNIIFDVELENGKNITFEIWFTKREVDRDLLVLEDENITSHYRNWDYRSSETEITDFYQGFDQAWIRIDGRDAFISEDDEKIRVKKVETKKNDGDEESYLTIKFDDAMASHKYHPSDIYLLTNGVFKGVIE